MIAIQPGIRTDAVMAAMKSVLIASFNASGVFGGVVFVGNPEPQNIEDQLSTKLSPNQFLVGIYTLPASTPQNARAAPRFAIKQNYGTCPLIATIAQENGEYVVTFSGSVIPGLNIHLLIGNANVDVYYLTNATDTLQTVTTALLGIAMLSAPPGTSIAQIGTALSIIGSPLVKCNIAAVAGTITREVGAVMHRIQISVWARTDCLTVNQPDLPATHSRSVIRSIITGSMGTLTTSRLFLPDSTIATIKFATDAISEKGVGSLSIFEYHAVYSVTHGIVETYAATPVGATSETVTVQDNPIVTLVGG